MMPRGINELPLYGCTDSIIFVFVFNLIEFYKAHIYYVFAKLKQIELSIS